MLAYAWAILLSATVLMICCCWCNCIGLFGRCAQRAFNLPCLRCADWGTTSKTARGVEVEGRKDAGANGVQVNHWDCFATIPFLVTCGFCCGALKETPHELPLRTNVPVAQPMADRDANGTTGAEAVVAVRMPLLGL